VAAGRARGVTIVPRLEYVTCAALAQPR
jgi:hypothetical protein